MAASQKQIAEELGVSIALVSRVLSGKAEAIGVAPDTIARVLETASRKGYVPSAAALSLKGKATRTVGVVVYDFGDPFFGATVEQLQFQAHKHHYSLVLTGFLDRTPREQDLRPLHKHAIDGLVVIGSDPDAAWLQRFDRMPVARIGHGAPEERSVRIMVDEEQSAELLLNHLLERGRNRLAYLSADLPHHRLRQEAFERAAKRCGAELFSAQSPERDCFTAGMSLASDLAAGNDPLTASLLRQDLTALGAAKGDQGSGGQAGQVALVCATDQVAMGALHALHGAGISTPDAVAVTGFDDIAASGQFIPPITTIRQPVLAMVQHAFAAVTWKGRPGETLLRGELVVRESA